MNIKKLLIFFLLMIASMNTASAEVWTPNSSMVSGLTDVGKYSAPAVFLDNGTLKLISGNLAGTFVGWYWGGSIWVEDSSIVSGLGDVGEHSSPAIFNDSGTRKLISGDWEGTFTGWYWSGSTWVLDASIVSGLGSSVERSSRPTVFFDGSTLKLISGQGTAFIFTDTLNGWYWSGSTWVSDASVVSGTSDSVQFSAPSVFNDDGTLKLISGDYWGTFKGWYWSGSTWVSDSSIKSGLGDVGWRSTPHVYLDGSDFKVIVGEDSGLFVGYNELHLYALSGTITNENGAVSNATIVLSGAGGSTTSNETGYYEITSILPSSYTINVTESLHYDYSDSVSITSDTEKNILLTLIPTEPVVASPPFVPLEEATLEPVPITPEEPVIIIIEEIMILISSPFNWILILFTYLGATLGKVMTGNEEHGLKDILADVGLYGTLAWIVVLFINLFISIIPSDELFSIIVFFASGFIVASILSGRQELGKTIPKK